MKHCFGCWWCFESEEWACPQCGFRPMSRKGVLCFLEDPPVAGDGFEPEYFRRLAGIEERNFWFRARNQLFQWTLARVSNVQCINVATTASHCLEKSRAPVSSSSESLLPIRCYCRL